MRILADATVIVKNEAVVFLHFFINSLLQVGEYTGSGLICQAEE